MGHPLGETRMTRTRTIPEELREVLDVAIERFDRIEKELERLTTLLGGEPLNRTHEYRDVLGLWGDWWNENESRFHGTNYPPLKRTRRAFDCETCYGEQLTGRCPECGRKP